jgi:hypothetical protein
MNEWDYQAGAQERQEIEGSLTNVFKTAFHK